MMVRPASAEMAVGTHSQRTNVHPRIETALDRLAHVTGLAVASCVENASARLRIALHVLQGDGAGEAGESCLPSLMAFGLKTLSLEIGFLRFLLQNFAAEQ